jgi:hypothetical protein
MGIAKSPFYRIDSQVPKNQMHRERPPSLVSKSSYFL